MKLQVAGSVLLAVLAAGNLGGPSNEATTVGIHLGDSAEQAAVTDPAVVGQWSPPVTWPLVGVHAVLMNNGKVLVWQSGPTAKVWDPATDTFTNVPDTFTDLFCAGHVHLATGKVASIGGGGPGAQAATAHVDLFDPQSQTWTPAAPMLLKRWYPTGTALGDGRILSTGGADGCVSCYVQTPEVYDPIVNVWTLLSGATNSSTPSYPFMFLLPSGGVIEAGASEFAIPTDVLDVGTRTWTTVDGRVIDGGSAVMYRPGQIMKAGSASDSGFSGASSNTTFVLDATQPASLWRQTAPMAFARSFLNLTILPDGNVVATGGATTRDGMNVANAVKAAEMWSAVSETWTTMAVMQTPRLYHSIGLLLPDARVLVAGGGADAGVADQLSAEIFSPPYLFKGPRPSIASSPAVLAYGTHFFVGTPGGADIASVSLIRNGAVTHSTNMEQRYVNLSFTPVSGGLDVTAPANANLAPPGYYMLFLVNGSGVPSVSSFAQLPRPAADAEPPTAPTNVQTTISAGTVDLSWSAATDNVAVANYNIHRATVSGFAPSAANRIAQPAGTSYRDASLTAGTYYYRVTAQDAAGNVSAPSNEASAVVSAGGGTPVRLVGNATVELTVDWESPGVADAFQYTATATGSLAKLQLYVDATSTAPAIIVGLYSNASGPSALLTSGTMNSPVAGAWNAVSVPAVNVTAGTAYWITTLNPTGGGNLRWRETSTGTYRFSSGTGRTSLPTTWTGAGTFSGSSMSAYGTTSPSASPPPTVSITSPTTGSNFSAPANIVVSADAAAAPGLSIRAVDFFRGATLLCTVTTSPFTCGWNGVGAGSYSLTARATDSAGVATTSSPVSITVAGPTTVSITSPANGASFTAPANISITASASAGPGPTIAKVEFFQGVTLLCTVTTIPFTCAWNSVGVGSYSLTAKATDSAGVGATSTAVNITVTSGGGTPVRLVGNQTVEPTVDYENPGVADAFQYTATATGTLTKLQLYVHATSTAPAIIIGLYSNASGPSTLLTSGTMSSPVAGAWNAVSVPAINVTAGTVYWIATLNPTASGNLRWRQTSAGTYRFSSGTGRTSLPATWTGAGTFSGSSMSAYGTDR